MSVINPAYFGREQTAVKHRILERYLTPFTLILGRSWVKEIVFIDCCSGPWNTVLEDKSDSSFGIAVSQLRNAREKLKLEGHSVGFRCLFIEKDPAPYVQLEEFCRGVLDVDVKPMQGDFTEHISDILRLVNEKPGAFPFFFIDPKGWSPLKLTRLIPLLRHEPNEVLINFMTSHIRRFLEDEGKDFGQLLGAHALEEMRGLTGQERDDAAAFAYADQIAEAGNYGYVCTTLVLNPQKDQTHYHLIYATRHPKGVEEFKRAERNAAEFMSLARAEVRQREKTVLTGQEEMFTVEEWGATHDLHLERLRVRYLRIAHDRVRQKLMAKRGYPVPYEEAWKTACRFPLVWESDLHTWIKREWGTKITLLGMKPSQHAPKCQAGNSIVWTA